MRRLDWIGQITILRMEGYVQPRINANLLQFGNGWNNDPMSSEWNMSPAHLCSWGHHSNSSSH